MAALAQEVLELNRKTLKIVITYIQNITKTSDTEQEKQYFSKTGISLIQILCILATETSCALPSW